MRELKAITLDLWGTILHPKDTEGKIEARRAIVLGALREAGLELDVPRLREAYRAAARAIHGDIEKTHIDIGPAARWAILTRQVGLPLEAVPYSRIAPAYEDVTLEFIPPLMPGVAATIEGLRRRYRLGLICNTGYTGGAVLREVLKRYGLHDHFSALVFSNEFGRLKPDPRIFRYTLDQLGAPPGESLHAGDVEEHDVAGAHASGMLAARYLPDGPVPTRADLVFHHWDEFAHAVADGEHSF